MFLRNFYDKSRRSIEKPLASGPAAYVFPASEKRSGSQARLLRILQLQHVEVSRLASATTVDEPERTNEAGKKTADIAGRRRFPAGSWWCAWTSRTRASLTPCQTARTGRRRPNTTPPTKPTTR